MSDAGTDAAIPDAGPPLACSTTTRVTPALDEVVTVMFDTRTTTTRPRDLGLACGNSDPELRWAPQEVIELVVPGSGQLALSIDTSGPGSEFTFNTVVQVRRDCERVPTSLFPPVCFDEDALGFQAVGATPVMGGETVFILVTGHSEPERGVDMGPVQVDLQVFDNEAPSLVSASLSLNGFDATIVASGNDPDRNMAGVTLNFYRADGSLLDIYGDGVADEEQDAFPITYDPAPRTADYSVSVRVPGSASGGLAPYLRAVRAATARVRAFDQAYFVSEPITIPIEDLTP